MKNVGIKTCLSIGTIIATLMINFGFTLPPGSDRALCIVIGAGIEIIALLLGLLLKCNEKCWKVKNQVSMVTENRDALKASREEIKQENKKLVERNFQLVAIIASFSGVPKAKQQEYTERFIEQNMFENDGRNGYESRISRDSDC